MIRSMLIRINYCNLIIRFFNKKINKYIKSNKYVSKSLYNATVYI